jgi:hypothetical protein
MSSDNTCVKFNKSHHVVHLLQSAPIKNNTMASNVHHIIVFQTVAYMKITNA